MPHLKILQSHWAMERMTRDGSMPSMSTCLERIHAAGFDGISAHFHTQDQVERWIDQAQAYGFTIEGQAYPEDIEGVRSAVELAAKHGIHHVAVQGRVRPYNAAAALPILKGWNAIAAEHGVQLLVETHRNNITCDLWSTREMLELYPELPLLADLSHYVSGQEIILPVADQYEEAIGRIIANARAWHGRVASSQQVQVEIGLEAHRPWVELFARWWRQGFDRWLLTAGEDDVLTFTCELGPWPYAIPGPDGFDMTDRWQDALTLRELVNKIWNEAIAARAKVEMNDEPTLAAIRG